MTPHAVFDCVVLLQAAARANSPAGICLAMVETGAVHLCLSPQVLAELQDVLHRPKIRKFKTLADERVDAFLTALKAKAITLDKVPAVFTYPRDPDDEPYVNLAVAAGANYLVSRDNDLLDLMRQDLPEARDFRQRFPDLKILNPIS